MSYLRSLCGMVFGKLSEVARELPGLFAGSSGACAVLVLWASGQLSDCVNQVVRHVMEPGPSLSVVGQCGRLLLAQTGALAELGLDLRFQLEQQLSPIFLLRSFVCEKDSDRRASEQLNKRKKARRGQSFSLFSLPFFPLRLL